MKRLIVGLGNPGSAYEMTRHNLGFLALKALSARLGCSFKKERMIDGEIATGRTEKDTIYLFLPMTYMNLSGRGVRKAVEYFGIPWQGEKTFLVVTDDVYLPFGSLRFRQKGSSGGHNGLKSLEEHLHSKDFARLRLGIGPKEGPVLEPLEDYVLKRFTPEEQVELPTFLDKVVKELEEWVQKTEKGEKK